jgi:hypothetical protein
MQNMQRRFGKLLPRSADESQVAVLLSEFEDAEKMLARVHFVPERSVAELIPSVVD